MAKVLGVDPGLSGALAVLDGSDLTIFDMPVYQVLRNRKNKRELDLHRLHQMFREIRLLDVDVAYVERVASMPAQGVSSVFAFGFCAGAILQGLACCEFQVHHVSPQVWRKELGVRQGKEGSVMRASELLPKHTEKWRLKKHHNRAEASLIAYYGLTTMRLDIRPRVRIAREG